MSWPSGPPPMPAPGWYDDPEQQWTWRYWDGSGWTAHRAPMWVPPVRDPLSFSVWFERGIATGKIAAKRIGLLLVAVWVLLGASSWWLIVASLDGDDGRELRRSFDADRPTFGENGSSVTTNLTDAEADRAWELMQDIFWSALPWLVVLTLAYIVLSAWSVALVARTAGERSGSAVVGALRRLPVVLGSGMVVFAAYAAVWTAASLPVVLVALTDGGGAAIVVTVVFVVFLVLVVTAWLWVRLALATVIAARGGDGLGVRRSWNLTRGRFWPTAGRLVVTGLVAGAVGGVFNSVTAFGQFLDFSILVAIVFVLQAVATAVSFLITTCGQLAAVEQLDEAELHERSRRQS